MKLICAVSAGLLLSSGAYAQPVYAPHLPTILEFSGGPIGTFGTVVGGSGCSTPGTYNAVPLTGGSGTGATANITVAAGAVTVVALVKPGASVGTTGAVGYTTNDSLSASAANIGGGCSGFSVPVATIAPYSWTAPSVAVGYLWLSLDVVSGGGGGGCGNNSGGNSGGGGGGGSGNYFDQPFAVAGGATLTIQNGNGGTGCVISGAAASAGTSTTITGGVDAFLPNGVGGAPTSGAAGVGGNGGNGGPNNQANGGAGGLATVTPAVAGGIPGFTSVHYGGGSSGGGGGGDATVAANGGGIGPFGGTAAGSGNAAGGGGAKSLQGRGGNGGGGTSPSAGSAPTAGWGGGGGGGGPNFGGGNGTGGFVRIKY